MGPSVRAYLSGAGPGSDALFSVSRIVIGAMGRVACVYVWRWVERPYVPVSQLVTQGSFDPRQGRKRSD